MVFSRDGCQEVGEGGCMFLKKGGDITKGEGNEKRKGGPDTPFCTMEGIELKSPRCHVNFELF